MKRKNFWAFFLFILSFFIFLSRHSWPQLILGQYEDEAPVGTWNTLGITNASSISLGNTRFAFATDCSASLSNPALLSNLPKITFSLISSFNSASFFKYSLVNTGIIYTDKNIFLNSYAIDFAGVSVRVKNWAFSLSQALAEIYDRPSTEQNYYYRGSLYYTLNFNQEGELKVVNFSISRKISNRISFGIGLNYIYGNLRKKIQEKWIDTNITITDDKSFEFQGYYLNGGLWVGLSDKFSIAAIFRTPYSKKAESQSLHRYQSPSGNTDIKIEASSQNTYKQPLVIGLGMSYQFSPKLRVASDFSFFNWSKYKVIYFEEELDRNFKDIVKIGAGIEYLSALKIFNQEVEIPFRAGMIYDPQPMREPSSSYLLFSFGAGIHWEKFLLDIGAFVGKERGSGDSLSAQKVILSLSFLM